MRHLFEPISGRVEAALKTEITIFGLILGRVKKTIKIGTFSFPVLLDGQHCKRYYEASTVCGRQV